MCKPIPVVNMIETGKNIKKMREKAGMTVKEVQQVFGFSTPQAIYRWEYGKTIPCVDNLVILAAVL